MASIRKIKGKTGTAYKITVMTGRDAQGKQKRHYKTFTPPEGLTAKQAEKAAKQAAVEFEKEIELGYHLNADQTFEEYAWYVIRLKEHSGGAKTTLSMHEYTVKTSPRLEAFLNLKKMRSKASPLLAGRLGIFGIYYFNWLKHPTILIHQTQLQVKQGASLLLLQKQACVFS